MQNSADLGTLLIDRLMHRRFLRWFTSTREWTIERALDEILIVQFAQARAAGSDEIAVWAKACTNVARIAPGQVIIEHVATGGLKLLTSFIQVHIRRLHCAID